MEKTEAWFRQHTSTGCVMIVSKSKSEAGHPSARPLKTWYLAHACSFCYRIA
jgi:hypothetical protein